MGCAVFARGQHSTSATAGTVWSQALGAVMTIALTAGLAMVPAAPVSAEMPTPEPLQSPSGGPSEPPEPAVPCVAEQPTEALALHTAQACDDKVKILDATSEAEQSWALPDGQIQTQLHTAPVRVQQDDTWVPIDLTLVEQPDGSIAPVAHPDGLVVAGPTTSSDVFALATLGEGDERLSMGYTGTLPEPELDGPTATYTDVKPGVDLVVEATVTGVESFYIIKTRAAANSVEELTVPIAGPNVAAHRFTSDGRLTLIDEDNKTLGFSPTPLMWDSRVDPTTGEPADVRPMESEVTRLRATDSSPDAAPIDGTGVVMEITPDAAFLADRDTIYPVTLDPEVRLDSPEWDTWVREQTTTDQSTSITLQIGAFTSGRTARSYINWHTTGFIGKHISAATMGLYNYESNACSTTWQIWSTWAGISTASRWGSQPALRYPDDPPDGTSSATKAGPTGCTGAGFVYMNSKKFFQRHSDTNANIGYMRVNATAEDDAASAKNFYSGNYSDTSKVPYALVTHDAFPTVGTRSTIPTTGCVTGSGRPFINTATPTLRAAVTDPEGSTVKAEFEWWSTSAKLGEATSTAVASGSTISQVVPAGQFTDGGTYKWRVRGHEADAAGEPDWSGWCEFTVDTSPPSLPTITSNTTHPDSSRWYSARTATIEVSATDTSGIAGWSIVTDAIAGTTAPLSINNNPNGTNTFSLANLPDGVRYIHVAARDNTNRWSQTEHFKVQIDGTAPGAPLNIRSSSHPVDTVTYASRTINTAWDAPADTSGIAAWAVVVDQTPSTLPSTATATQPGTTLTHTHTIPGAGAGSWWVHVRGKDNAGNWSAAAAHFKVTLAPAFALVVADPGPQTVNRDTAVSLASSASGGTVPYTWSATSLPPGLSINATSGQITGTPTTAGTFASTLTVTDSAAYMSSIPVVWTVRIPLVAVTGLTAERDGAQTVNLAWTSVPGATGYHVYRDGAHVATTTSWPAFVDRQLQGGQEYSYQVRAVDPVEETPLTTAVTVTTAAAPMAPVNVARCGATAGQPGCTYTSTVAADVLGPDTGGRSLTDGIRGAIEYGPAWQRRSNVSVYSFTVDLGAPKAITEITSGWLQIKADNVLLPPSLTYSTSTDGVTFTNPTVINRPSAGDADQIVTYRALGLTATARYVKVDIDGGAAWTAIDELEIRGLADLAITDPGPLTGTTGVPLSTRVLATGGRGAIAWSATGLPAGVTINPTTGILSGTPSTPGASSATITVTDADSRTANYTLSWNVTLPVTVTGLTDRHSVEQEPASVTAAAAGGSGSYQWTAAGLPAGVTIAPTTGVISGQPTQAGEFDVTVTATDAQGRTGETTFTWQVYADAATGPTIDAARISTIATGLHAARGVTALGDYAYVIDGFQLVRIHRYTGATTDVAGSLEGNLCEDVVDGVDAVFYESSVVGTDGTLVYVSGPCGIRSVDPGTGATRVVTSAIGTAPITSAMPVIANGNVYGWGPASNGTAELRRADLDTGSVTVLHQAEPGYLAADDTHLWWIVGRTLYRVDATTGVQTTITTGLPSVVHGELLSVGSHIYAAYYEGGGTRQTSILRISKADGSTRLVAGEGINGGQVLTGLYGLATDGTRLYALDIDQAQSGGSAGIVAWLKAVTPVGSPMYASAASGALIGIGAGTAVTEPGLLGSAAGVAVLGNYTYVADGHRILKINKSTGAAVVLAGSTTAGCVDANTGADSRFRANSGEGDTPTVIGHDGHQVYVHDECGFRSINPSTGATYTLGTAGEESEGAVIVGHTLFNLQPEGGGLRRVYRHDLTTGTITALGAASEYESLTADNNHVWAIAGRTLYRIDPATGTRTTVTTTLSTQIRAGIASVGDYLYVSALLVPVDEFLPPYVSLMWIRKSDGANAYLDLPVPFQKITAIAANGSGLAVLETDDAGTEAAIYLIKRAKSATWSGGPTLWRETAGGSNPSEGDPCNSCQGDPVQTDTGALLEPVTDVTIPTTGLPLTMSRTYSSATADTRTPVGYGWSWPHGMRITEPADQPGLVHVAQENGSVTTFTRQPNSTYTAAPRVRATLVKNGNGTWTFVRENRTTIAFDATGRVTQVTDLNNQTLQYTYTGNLLTRATHPGGRYLSFAYDANGYLTTVTTPSGARTTYTHNSGGDLTSSTDPTGATTEYRYDAQHLLTSVTSPRGGMTTNTYDMAHRVIRQRDPLGRLWAFGYVDGSDVGTSTVTVTAPGGARTIEQYVDGQLRSQTAAAGTSAQTTVSYEYDPVTSQPTKITGPDGAITEHTYNAAGKRLSTTDPLERVTAWTYDVRGNETSRTTADGEVSSATYDARGNQESFTTPSEKVTQYTYNANGSVNTARTPGGNVTEYTYLPNGDLASITDPEDRTVTFTYNSDGRVTSLTDPGGRKTTNSLDAAGRITKVTDPMGHTTSFTYDDDGNRRSITDGNGNTSTTTVDVAGQTTRITDAAGHHTDFTYTPAGLLETTVDAENRTTKNTYDPRGNLLAVTEPGARTTHYTYDNAGRQLTATTPAGKVSTTEYNDAGEVSKTLDGKNKATTYTYDAVGRPHTTTDPNNKTITTNYTLDGQPDTVTNPDSTFTNYDYDDDGNLTTITNPDGRPTTHTYNKAGQMRTRTLPGGLTTTYDYDNAGRVERTIGPDTSTITRTYDNAGQVIHLAYSNPGTSSVSYKYDNAGQRTSMTDGTGTTTYTHDTTGRTTKTEDGAGNTVGYAYNNTGQLTQLKYPNNEAVDYTYYPSGDMKDATDWAGRTTTFTWTDDGEQHTQTFPNGVTTTTEYDPNGQVDTIDTTKGSTTLAGFTYTYDDAQQLTGNTTPTGAHTFSYSPTKQLASITTTSGTGATGDYTTTPAGLLTGLPDGTTLAYNTRQQLETTTPSAGTPATTYQYDQRGNRTTSTPAGATPTTYTYDQANRLTGATVPIDPGPSTAAVTYTYDGNGLRHTRTRNANTTAFVWATAADLPLLLDGGTHRYLYGPGLTPYAQVAANGTIEYLHTDHLGSVTQITDSAGTVVGTTEYDPYGRITARTGSGKSAIGYTGGWTDLDTGLVYLRTRDYDPTTGQFLTVDPVVDITGQPYAYVGNNPLQDIDPAGLCADCNFFEKLVLAGPSEEDLTTGVTGKALNFVNGVSDEVSMGFTQRLRRKITPGYACKVEKSGWYTAGQNTGFIGSMAIPGAGAIRAGYSAYKGARAMRSVTSLASRGVGRRLVKAACSFAGSTQVLLADGISKNIEDVERGDVVIVADPESGEYSSGVVAHAWAHEDDLYSMVVDGHKILTTEDHRFWNATDRRWERADQVDVGDQLLSPDGATVTVDSFSDSPVQRDTAYNLTIDGIHTYFVSAGEQSVLVHNDCFNILPESRAIAEHAIKRSAEPGGFEHFVRNVDPRALDAYVDGILEGQVPNVITRYLKRGRVAHWDPDKSAVVIEEGAGGTVFTPREGKIYFDDLE
jgi:RHS repeat-associated protein